MLVSPPQDRLAPAFADALEQERLQRLDVVGGEDRRLGEDRAETVGEEDVAVVRGVVVQVGARRQLDRRPRRRTFPTASARG